MTANRQPNSIDVHIGRRIRAIREQSSKTVANVACDLGVSEADYEARETGQLRFPAQDLFVLAQLFGVRVAYFFDCLSGVSINRTEDDAQRTSDPLEQSQAARLLDLFLELADDEERESLLRLAGESPCRETPTAIEDD